MTQITPTQIGKQMQLEMCICTIFIYIESYFQDSIDEIKKILYQECAAIKNRYQTDLSYKQEDLGSDLFAFYNKISFYTQSTLLFYLVVQRLLCEFQSSQKLGEVVKIINDCLMNAFRFLKDHTKQRRNYIAERIIELQEKLRVQVPGHCNRCKKFIMSRDIEETKVLIGAGQFKDPFNLFQMGMSDLLLNHKMQQDIEYKLKYAQVWDNKKKIQQKLHMMLIDCDKKAYGIAFSVSQIQKLESVIKTIATQFALNRDGMEKRDSIFTENLEKLVKIIFYKIKAHQVCSKTDREIQTETHQLMKIQEMTKNSEKLNKKMNDLKKKLAAKEKEISDMFQKNEKQAEQNSKGTLQKNSMQIVMRNLVSQHVEESKKIQNLFNEKKQQQNKIKFLEKETYYLKNQIQKLNDQIIIQNAHQNQIQSLTPQNQKSAKSFKFMKSIKNLNDTQEPQENYSNNQNIRNKWRDSNESSINENLRKSRVLDSMRKLRIESSGKSSKAMNKQGQTSKENNEIIVSKRNPIKKNSQLRQMSSFSVEKNTTSDPNNEKEFKSRVSIALENETIHHGSKYLIEEKPKSVKKSRNVVKSMRKIQKSVKNQQDEEDDTHYYLEEGNLSTVSNKKIKGSRQKSAKSKSEISQKEQKPLKQQYATQTENTQLLSIPLNKNNPSLRNSVNVFNNEKYLQGTQKSSIHNGSSNKTKALVRASNSKTIKHQSKQEKILLSTTLPVLTQNENANKTNKNQTQVKDELQQTDTLEKVYSYYERKISQQRNEMQFEGSFNNVSRLSIDNFESYFKQFIDNLMNKQKTTQNINNSIQNSLQTAPVTPKKIQSGMDHKLQPLSVHRFSSLNQQTQFSQRKNQSSLNLSFSNGFSQWEKNSEASTHISPFSISVFNSRLLVNKESYLSDMADKLSKMYFSLEQAYKVEKSKYSSELVQINENETNDPQNLKEIKSLHHNSLKTKPDIISLILNKSEIRYMNMIVILLMKLHEVFPQAYETIKKVITKPFSSQNKKLLKMKNKQNKDEENPKPLEQTSSIRDGIAKLILLHRKCCDQSLPSRNSLKNNGTLFGGELKKFSDWKQNSVQKQKLSTHNKQLLCKHLLDFQICLQKDNNLNFGVQENESKIQNLENQQNFNQA